MSKLSIDDITKYYTISECGEITRIKTGHKVRQITDRDGYKIARLSCNNIQETFRVHRLVCEVYIANPENKPQVNHKNSIRDDNRVSNLEWVTAMENNLHKYLVGNGDRGVKKITNQSGHVGVHFDKNEGRFVVQCQRNNKRKKIGRFKTLAEAVKAYWKAANNKELWDEPIEYRGGE